MRTVLHVAFCLMLAGVGLAQAPGPASSGGMQKLEAISQELNLSPEQKTQLMPILKEEMPKIQAIKSNTSLTGGEKLQQLRAVHEQTDSQIKPILSADQYTKWQQIRQQQMHDAMQKRRAEQPQ